MGDIYGIELDLLTWYCGFESLIIVMFFVFFFEHTHTHANIKCLHRTHRHIIFSP